MGITVKNLFLVLSIQLLTFSAFAGNVANIFSDGIFGVAWGSAHEEVKEVFPDGETSDEYGVLSYRVKDGRSLFGIERASSNNIKFTFDANNRLMGALIDFPLESVEDFGVLMNKLNTTFGESVSVPNSFGITIVEWPMDEELKISVSHIPGMLGIGELYFAVEYKPIPEEVTKEKLGF